MDLVGKMFRNSIRTLHVNGFLEKRMEGLLYSCSFLDKGLYGYGVASNIRYLEDNIINRFSECPNTDIISKAEHMLGINYIACSSIVNNIKIVESSNYYIKVSGHITLWGHYVIDIRKDMIWLKPIDKSELCDMCEAITKEDYYKIFNKVKQLRKDLDKLWTDVV